MWEGYHFIMLMSSFLLPYFVCLTFFFLFVHNHWDLDYLANWDKIWHKHMERVGVGFYIIKIRITGFFGL